MAYRELERTGKIYFILYFIPGGLYTGYGSKEGSNLTNCADNAQAQIGQMPAQRL